MTSWKSCIYRGKVLHRRRRPTAHVFRYSLFMMYLDLDELDSIFRGRWFWSTRFPNIAWFRRKEHLGCETCTLKDSISDLVKQQTGRSVTGSVRMLTHLRYFGFQMNPVSFFYCFDHEDNLEFVVAEVNNTPWGEQHCYVLEADHFQPAADRNRQELGKEFHVSPFMPMEMTYRWRVSTPCNRLNIGIQNYDSNGQMLNVAMTLERRPIQSRSLGQVLFQYPFMTMKIFAGIYWQAFRLWRKRTPFFRHPGKVSSSNGSVSHHV